MFENSLYNITASSTEMGQNLFTIEINPDHEVFKGHFPDMPVLPGVCSLTIIKNLASETIGKKLVYSNIKECKFLSAILPNKCNIIDVKLAVSSDDNDIYTLKSEVVCDSKVVVKLKARMK